MRKALGKDEENHLFFVHACCRGMYRRQSNLAHQASKKWKRDASHSLVTLDHLWWRIRNHLDSYLESAQSEIRHVQGSFIALANYDKCQSGFEHLLKSYASSMSKMKKSHHKLKTTWREVSDFENRRFFL